MTRRRTDVGPPSAVDRVPLSHAWGRAEAALPRGWRLRGVELLNHFAKQGDPTPDDVWHAWASEHRHGQGGEVYGAGPTVALALDDLAINLRAHPTD